MTISRVYFIVKALYKFDGFPPEAYDVLLAVKIEYVYLVDLGMGCFQTLSSVRRRWIVCSEDAVWAVDISNDLKDVHVVE